MQYAAHQGNFLAVLQQQHKQHKQQHEQLQQHSQAKTSTGISSLQVVWKQQQ